VKLLSSQIARKYSTCCNCTCALEPFAVPIGVLEAGATSVHIPKYRPKDVLQILDLGQIHEAPLRPIVLLAAIENNL
jgi:hypothetical protein